MKTLDPSIPLCEVLQLSQIKTTLLQVGSTAPRYISRGKVNSQLLQLLNIFTTLVSIPHDLAVLHFLDVSPNRTSAACTEGIRSCLKLRHFKFFTVRILIFTAFCGTLIEL